LSWDEQQSKMSTFTETGLKENILKAIGELGFIEPTPIQEKTIPHLLQNEGDLVALAQTGTGKTAAFGLPIIDQIDTNSNKTQALVLCPTRELCVQITNDISSFSKYAPKIDQLAVYGGTSIEAQIRTLKRGAQIVVGTPGRVNDLIRRKVLKLGNIRWLVLDEADEMLNMGFKEEIDTILAETPEKKQTLLFSATMPKEIARIASKYMSNPEEISVGKKNAGAENVEHDYYVANARDRYEVLKRIADMHPKIYAIVFCRTRRETKEVADNLISDGYNADALHGDLSQAQRDHVMNRFRQKHLQLLVATDVAARGLDVNDLTHVINYNLPDELEAYVHRTGRTGRAGKKGVAITIVHTREIRKIKDLERIIGKKIDRRMIPRGKEVCAKQLFNLIDKVEKVEVNDAQIDEFLPEIYNKLEWLSREDLIKHFVSVEFNQILAYYKNADDINVSISKSESGQGKGGRKERRPQGDFSRFYINVGQKNQLSPPRMIGLINDHTQRRDIEIGRIDIMKGFSFFEVESKYEEDIIKGFKNGKFDNISLRVELSKPDTKSSRDDSGRYGGEKRKRTRTKRSRNRSDRRYERN
jgi:ATP-dependent RNA helicase DeaD